MSKETKVACILGVLIFELCLISECGVLVRAHAKNSKEKPSLQNVNKSPKDDSSNEIGIENEIKLKIEGEQQYYLPKQTEFGSSITPSTGGVFVTSPPRMTLNPAPVQTYHEHSTDSLLQSQLIDDDYITPYLSHCVSETLSFNSMGSEFLIPSEVLMKESVILSGHVAIPSKTSGESDNSGIPNVGSHPSVALKGTQVDLHSVTDM